MQTQLLFEFQISKPEATSAEGKLFGSPKNICNASYLLAEKSCLTTKQLKKCILEISKNIWNYHFALDILCLSSLKCAW